MTFPEPRDRWSDAQDADFEAGSEAGADPRSATSRFPQAWWRFASEFGEDVASEWKALAEALTAPGSGEPRKWLGWALFRLAARVNPEVRER
ncbi:MAG: hypothetical protein AAF430_07505 [Myxococcota bacterium]